MSAPLDIVPRSEATATALGAGQVLVAGGFGGDGTALADVALLPADGRPAPFPFSALSPLPQGRARHAAVAIDGGRRVALVGGETGSAASPVPLATTLVLDPDPAAAAPVTAGPDLPQPLFDAEAVLWDGGTPADAADDAVILVGGRDASGSPTGLVLRWTLSPPPGSVSVLGTLSTARAGHTATLGPEPSGGFRIHVIGGVGPAGAVLGTTEVIDPAAGTVTPGPDLPAPRARHAAVTVVGPVGGPAGGPAAAVLVAGGLDQDLSPRGDAALLVLAPPAARFSDLGRFGPAAFDLLALPLGDGDAVLLGGFSSLAAAPPGEPAPAGPLREAALFAFDAPAGGALAPAGGAAPAGGNFLDLPDFDLGRGGAGLAGAVLPGSRLGAEGTGSLVVAAGGLGPSGEPRGAFSYDPYNRQAARFRSLDLQAGPEKTLMAAALLSIFGVIERTREYGAGRLRDIDLTRVEDPLRGTLVRGEIGEFEVRFEVDGGIIHGEAAGESFLVYTEGNNVRADGLDLHLHDDSIEGRYYLSWKKSSIKVEMWRFQSDLRFEGKIGAEEQDRNTALETEGEGERTDRHRSFFDSRGLDLSR